MGDCLEVTAAHLYTYAISISENIEIRALGIDSNPTNIHKAKGRFPHEFLQFECANTLELEEIVKQYNPNNDYDVIVTFSGSSTRSVLNGTYDALRVIQSRGIKLMVMAGETEVLITRKIANKVGLDTEFARREETLMPLYILTPNESMTIKMKKNHVDLSMHGDPLSLIKEYQKKDPALLAAIHSLNLGLAHLKQGEIATLLAALPHLKELTVSGKESWFTELSDFQMATHETLQVLVRPNDYLTTELPGESELRKFSPRFYKRVEDSWLPSLPLQPLQEQAGFYLNKWEHTNQRPFSSPKDVKDYRDGSFPLNTPINFYSSF